MQAGLSPCSISTVADQCACVPPPATGSRRSSSHPRTHTLAGEHRRRQAHAVQAVVDRHADAIDAQAGFRQLRQQRQGQVTVGDGGLVGRFPAGALGIGVDPLLVAGGVGEALDAFLVDRQPVAACDFCPTQADNASRSSIICMGVGLRCAARLRAARAARDVARTDRRDCAGPPGLRHAGGCRPAHAGARRCRTRRGGSRRRSAARCRSAVSLPEVTALLTMACAINCDWVAGASLRRSAGRLRYDWWMPVGTKYGHSTEQCTWSVTRDRSWNRVSRERHHRVLGRRCRRPGWAG